jgi:hypothetical protein
LLDSLLQEAFLYLSALMGATLAFPQIQLTGQGVPTLIRAPAHDSASIEHHRLGGNFAYSTAEAHAYAEVTPQISTLTHPVAETTNTHIPAPIATHQPAPIIKTTHVAQPIFKNIPTFGTQEISGPVRTHQTIHQPLVHETRTHTVQEVAQSYSTPVHATVGVPHTVAREHVVPGVAYAQVAAQVPVAHAGYAGYAGHGYAGYAGHGVALAAGVHH